MASPHIEREFALSDSEFLQLRSLVKKFTGISLGDEKRDLLYGRMTRRIRSLGANSFSEYISILEHDPEREKQFFINAITTNFTSFFRENHHFEYLSNVFIPEHIKKNDRIRIWSTGCSSGEEPYSILMTLMEALRHRPGYSTQIVATDIDTSMVEKAAGGVYSFDRIGGIPPAFLKKYFLKGTGGMKDLVRFSPEYADKISFHTLNLMDKWDFLEPFDVIFCRNVAIYFDRATQDRIYSSFHRHLNDGGLLIIGHSESLYSLNDKFDIIGKTIYSKARSVSCSTGKG